MVDIKIIQISQYQETPATTVRHPNFVYRYAYARSAESQAANVSGQDYIEIHEDKQRLVFVLCDGVGQSFFGDFAARFIGRCLSDWLWSNDLDNNTNSSQIELEKYLRLLTLEATEQIQNYQLPSDLPDLLRVALEEQRSYGSQSMFVAGMIDVQLNRIVLAKVGDLRIRLWESSSKEKMVFDDALSSSARWSTLRGLVNECKIFVGPLHGISRLTVYSDGLGILDKWKGYMPRSKELNSIISEAKNTPDSDDISFFEAILPIPVENIFEEQNSRNKKVSNNNSELSQILQLEENVANDNVSPLKPSRTLRVFLCHASDDKPAVRKLYERLTQDGIDAWLDERKLIPGQQWQIEIPKAVRNSDVVIVCLSSHSVTKEGFVQREIRLALDSATEKPDDTIFIIPARLENCEVPARIKKFHWVDLFSKDGHKRLMQALQIRAESLGVEFDTKTLHNTNKATKVEVTAKYENVSLNSKDLLVDIFQAEREECPICGGKVTISGISTEEGELAIGTCEDCSWQNYYP